MSYLEEGGTAGINLHFLIVETRSSVAVAWWDYSGQREARLNPPGFPGN